MVHPNDGAERETRPAIVDDLIDLCRRLNGLLLRLKQTHREKDAEDRLFLQELLKHQQ